MANQYRLPSGGMLDTTGLNGQYRIPSGGMVSFISGDVTIALTGASVTAYAGTLTATAEDGGNSVDWLIQARRRGKR